MRADAQATRRPLVSRAQTKTINSETFSLPHKISSVVHESVWVRVEDCDNGEVHFAFVQRAFVCVCGLGLATGGATRIHGEGRQTGNNPAGRMETRATKAVLNRRLPPPRVPGPPQAC